jgi:hypothetical protein
VCGSPHVFFVTAYGAGDQISKKKANKFDIVEFIKKEYGEWTVQADLDIYRCQDCGSYCSEIAYY